MFYGFPYAIMIQCKFENREVSPSTQNQANGEKNMDSFNDVLDAVKLYCKDYLVDATYNPFLYFRF